jgi:hypothetical protein
LLDCPATLSDIQEAGASAVRIWAKSPRGTVFDKGNRILKFAQREVFYQKKIPVGPSHFPKKAYFSKTFPKRAPAAAKAKTYGYFPTNPLFPLHEEIFAQSKGSYLPEP